MKDPGTLDLQKHILPSGSFEEAKRRLAKAVLLFQDKFVDLRVDSGSLVQVWLPERTADGKVVLRTKGLPFCVAGAGDLLALFRCISCRYRFGTNIAESDLLGAPGRVFSTGEAEMSQNVQQYSKDIYLRASEAQQCQIQSTIVLPLFDSNARKHSIGVLEVVQTAKDMPFAYVIATLDAILQGCHLWTCKPDSNCSREMSESSDTVKAIADRVKCSSPQTSGEVSYSPAPKVTDDNFTAGVSPKQDFCRDKSTLGRPRHQPASLVPPDPPVASSQRKAMVQGGGLSLHTPAQEASPVHDQMGAASHAGGAASGEDRTGQSARILSPFAEANANEPSNSVPPSNNAHVLHTVEEPLLDEGSDVEDDDIVMDDDDDIPTYSGARRGKGSGNPGKPGKRLRLADLQGQFGVGLKEAATRLGICPTTLKRACRRHGIQRWPRRQLLKLSRAIDQINATTQHADDTEDQNAVTAPGNRSDGNAGDGRWTHLAQLIPGLQTQLNEPPPARPEETGSAVTLNHAMDQTQGRQANMCTGAALPAVDTLKLTNANQEPLVDAFADSAALFAPTFNLSGLPGGMYSQPMTSENQGLSNPAIMSHPPEHQVPLSGGLPGFDWHIGHDEVLVPLRASHQPSASFPDLSVSMPQEGHGQIQHVPDGHVTIRGQCVFDEAFQHEGSKREASFSLHGRHHSRDNDLQDDVGIVDQSVLDLLLEVPA